MDFFRICLMFFQRGLYMITKLNNRELFQFCEQFSIILRSGMSAIEGLAILNDDSQTERGKEILTFLYKDMEESGSLAHAMEQSGAFPASAAAYVRTGEETGCLDEVMKGLSAFYAKEIQITDQIQSAVAYPLVMLGMMTAVIVILLVKVLPVFRQVFRQLGLEMSGISGALLGIGETLSRYSTAFLVLLAAMIGFILFLVLHPKGQELIRKIVCRFPGMKEIPVNLDYSRLCQCISLGIRSGLSPELCVELAGAVVSQTETREKLASIQKQLAEGYGFTEAITESGLFKAMELRLISLGFQAGASDEVMEKLAEQYEEKSTDSVSHIVSILEPTIVIVLSILVGLGLLSVIFETRLIRVRRIFRFIVPILFAAVLCLIFYLGIARTQTDSLEKEQVTLTQALEGGAIRTYALTGQYPQSLDELLSDYHITYDSEKFVVEYVPNGSNLLPSISVLPVNARKGGAR